MKNLPSLMYISQGKTPEEHISNIKNFCVAGGKWVQLRMKNMPLDTYMNTARVVQQICKEHDAILSINDHVEVALQTNTFGIHVGQNDIAPQIIRDKFLYKGAIGVTANTFLNISQCNPSLVAYIGLGPYKFTKTKKRLSSLLGIEGYIEILSCMQSNNINLPIYAIGGIEIEDVLALSQLNISGIAVSSMLTAQEDLETRVKYIHGLFEKS